jgi:hypothetical protein
MRKNSILLLAVLFLTQFVTAQAQDEEETSLMKGTESAAFQQQAENGKCFVFDKYTIKTISGENVGEDIKVYRRASSISADTACENGTAAYYTIKNADANYFAGLFGDYLFVDSGTGADGRGLEIFNLKSKKSIYSTEYYDELELQEGRFFIYDKLSKTNGALKNCREATQWKKDGFSIGWVRQAKLDLQTLKETPIGTVRCRAFQ